MSDVTEAPTQDAIAESLLGEETQEQQSVEQPETEQQIETPEVESQDVEQVEQEQVEETADDWLPGEQEKVFPDDVVLRYAQRYGLDENRLSDPLIRQLVHDKINSDILISQQREQEQVEEEPEVQREEPTPAQQLTPEQHFQNLERYSQERTDPAAAKWFHGNFLRAFGVPEAEIAKIPAEQAVQFGRVATAGIANVANTVIDDLLQSRVMPLMEQVFPGFADMYNRSAHAMAWDRVRNSDAQFAGLPAYGTKEFSAKLREAAEKVPEVAEMIAEADGKPMNASQTARWYTMLARIASGQGADPQLLQRAAAAGAKNARRGEIRRSAGNLGSGQSKAATGQRSSSKFQTNDDLFDDETMARYKQEHGRL